jgi:integrase
MHDAQVPSVSTSQEETRKVSCIQKSFPFPDYPAICGASPESNAAVCSADVDSSSLRSSAASSGASPEDVPRAHGGLLSSEPLQSNTKVANVSAVTVPSQRDGRSMNRRPGQRGTVNAVGGNHVGRYWADEPGSTKRVRRAVILGRLKEMTKSQAARKLIEHIEREGVNSPAHLARSQSLIATFGEAAELWRQRQLIDCGKSSSNSSMGCELRKHVLPLLKDKLIEDVNNYPLVRECIQIWREEEREDGKIGYGRHTIRNFFGHIRAVYNFYRDETAQHGKPAVVEWFVKWKKVAPPKTVTSEPPAFTVDEMVAIVNKAKKQTFRAFFAVAAGTAARASELFGLRCGDIDLEQGVVTFCHAVVNGVEGTTKSDTGDKDRTRACPIDSSIVQELSKHLNGRTNGLVFRTRNGKPLLLSNVSEDELRPILDDLGIWKGGMGMHSFRRGRISQWVYAGVTRQVIRDWAGHSADRLIDLYTRKMKQYHAAEMAKVKPLLDSKLDSKPREEVGAHAA